MKPSRRKLMIALTLLIATLLCASVAFFDKPALAQKQARRPILILTENGQVVVKIIGPKGANDVRVFWGGPGIPEGGGYGYWTKNGQEMPKSRFQFGSNINDIHFSTTGRVPQVPPIPAPPGANDVELRWEEDGRITEAWWTRDGQRMDRIPLAADVQELSLQFTPAPSQTTKGASATQLVGLVYDKDSRPGDQATMSVTTDPKKYESIPGLGVIEVKVPASSGAAAEDVIQGLVVDCGDGRRQTATQPLIVQLPKNAGSVPVRLINQSDPALAVQTSIQIQQSGYLPVVSNTGSPNNFTTPPVVQDIGFIRGPLSGSGNTTQIVIDDLPAKIVAESPRTVYFDVPSETTPGSHQMAIQDGTNGAMFPIVKMSLNGHIDRPALQRGQRTNYSVTLNFGELPQPFWQHGGGSCPELITASRVQQAAPGFHVPQAGEPGVVLLAINNASRDIVSILPSQDERVVFTLHQQDFQNNQFTTRGEIQSKVTGAFTIDLLGQSFFAPIGGQPLTLRASLSKIFCPDKCKPAGLIPGSTTTDVSITPQGFAPGEIDKMAAGVKVISNVPMPAAGKPIAAATTALLTGAFGAAEALAKRNGVTIWVRVSCKVCELENCLSIQRLNVKDHHSSWEKVMDLVQVDKNGGATMEANLTTAQIAAEIAAKASGLSCP